MNKRQRKKRYKKLIQRWKKWADKSGQSSSANTVSYLGEDINKFLPIIHIAGQEELRYPIMDNPILGDLKHYPMKDSEELPRGITFSGFWVDDIGKTFEEIRKIEDLLIGGMPRNNFKSY